MLGMTPTRYRAGGAGTEIRFAVGECSLGSILVASSDKGVCAILLGDDPDALAARPAGPLPAGEADRRRRGFRGTGRQGRRFRRGAGARARPAAGRARHRLSAAGLAGAARDPGGLDRQLSPISPGGSARRSPCGRSRRPAAPTPWRWPSPATAWCSSDGALSGYRWGVERKRALLDARGRRGMSPDERRFSTLAADRGSRRRGSRRSTGGGSRRSRRAGLGACCPACSIPISAGRSPASTPTRIAFAAASSWRGTASGAGSTSISAIRCPTSSRDLRGALYPAPGADRQPLERGDGDRRPLSRRTRGVPGALPSGRPARPTPLLLQYGAERLQLPAPGSLRRACVPAAGGDPAVRAGRGFHRRRVRDDRTAARGCSRGRWWCRFARAMR